MRPAGRRLTCLLSAATLAGCAAAPARTTAPDPTRLTLLAPSTRVLGTSLALRASSDNDLAVLRVDFLRGGRAFANDDTPPFEATLSLSETDNGPLTLLARASGLGGANISSEEVNLTVAVDRTPPRLRFTSPAISQRSRYQVAWQAEDENGIASLRLTHNGRPVEIITSGASSSATTDLVEGENSFALSATDEVGNNASEAALVWFRRSVPGDATPPSVAGSVSPSATRAEGVVTLSAEARDENGIAAVDFLWDGQVFATASGAPYQVTRLVTAADSGRHTVTARAYDRGGNDATSDPTTIEVSIPAIVIESKSVTVGHLASVSGHVVDDALGTTLTVSLDGGAPIEVKLSDGQFTFMRQLTPGTHTLTFHLTDGEGGSANASANLVVT